MHLFKKGALILLVSVLISCDKDFNTVGSDIIGENNFDFLAYRDSELKAYNLNLGAVQSNNLTINPLGVFNNSVFGKTTAHFVTQLELSSTNINQTIGDNVVVEKVELTIPYFSTLLSTETDGSSSYRLDSIYGNIDSKLILKIYENGFFLQDLSPNHNFSEAQKYYTDQKTDFDNNRHGTDADGNSVLFGEQLNNSSNVSQNNEFFFDSSEIVTSTINEEGETEVTSRSAPAMKIELDKDFFDKKIFSTTGTAALINNNVFKNYFRGLYFQVEEISGQSGAMALMNFAQGKITISYSEDSSTSSDEDTTTRVDKTLELNMTGNTVSLQEFSNISTGYQNALNNINTTTGDPDLYLKGGAGTMTIIELFGSDDDNNGIADQLEEIRNNGWMINEANLVFHINRSAIENSTPEPNRIYLYDLNNKRQLIDYALDQSTNGQKPKYSKSTYGGILEKDTDGRGTKYKIRLTNHISNLIRKDSTNIKLGLVVTEDYRLTTNNYRKTATPENSPDRIPVGSVISPLGTVLYGNHSDVPEDKKLKLEIFYTKPN
ncbi:MAG: DUF4270 domain-containing protein [Flavobacteriaceae bacterium]|jgi:hypothetical protein|nr:DUF4270 domain-containing protein [Flavobacteriaceae bacterium]